MKRAALRCWPGAQLRRRRTIAVLLASSLVSAAVFGIANADSPPLPDYFRAYGTVQISGLNLVPVEQPVLAFVNGHVCGAGETLIATAGEGTPDADVGKTAYIVDVSADGSGGNDQAGCGRAGDPVSLYFPMSERIAPEQPVFATGSARVNVDLGAPLNYQLRAVHLAGDGVP